MTCILGGALGIPMMMLGGKLAKLYGNGVALNSILIGNFILWLIGFTIISMAKPGNNALENIKNYLGKKTCLITALIWICSFLMWYVVWLKMTTEAMVSLFPHQAQYEWIVGVFLGLMIAVLSMKGICMIKKLSVYLFPYLIGFAIYYTAISNYSVEFAGSWGVSFVGILSIVFIWLPFTINLPTIFQHSISKAHSILGLTLITISHVFFQIFSIITGFDDLTKLILRDTGMPMFLFIISSCIMINILNIYFAGPALGMLRLDGEPGVQYLIIGLTGTALYIFFFTVPYFLSTVFLEEMLFSFIAILGVVLLFDFFVKAITRHRPRTLEKFWSSFCWFVGCITSMIVKFKRNMSVEKNIFVGVLVCTLTLFVIVFVEEAIWSIRNVKIRDKT